MNCVTCKAHCTLAGQHHVKTDCIFYVPKDYPKPITNADRIRDMKDDVELAILFDAVKTDGMLKSQNYPYSKFGWLDWLRQEVDND